LHLSVTYDVTAPFFDNRNKHSTISLSNSLHHRSLTAKRYLYENESTNFWLLFLTEKQPWCPGYSHCLCWWNHRLSEAAEGVINLLQNAI